MQLYKIRGGNLEDLEQKKYIIGIGISLGNKWFTTENVLELIKWSLEHTKDVVVVYVADYIHAINIEVRNELSREKAVIKAKEKGEKMITDIQQKATSNFSIEDQKRIIYKTWEDLTDGQYKKDVTFLYTYYEKDTEFKNYINTIVKNSIANEKRSFSDIQIERLSHYILEELPELINRVPIDGTIFDANAYPYDGETLEFAEKIQNGVFFSEVKKNVMRTEPKVFLEVR